MTIPKKRNYTAYLVAACCSVLVGFSFFTALAPLTQAFTVPEILRGGNTTARDNQRLSDRDGNRQSPQPETNRSERQTNEVLPVQVKPAEQNQTLSQQVTPEVTKAQTVTSFSQVSTLNSTTLPSTAVTSTDTSIQARELASAQSKRVIVPSQYVSTKISTDRRDDLYKSSLAAALVGSGLYFLSYAGALWNALKRNSVPVRRTITQ